MSLVPLQEVMLAILVSSTTSFFNKSLNFFLMCSDMEPFRLLRSTEATQWVSLHQYEYRDACTLYLAGSDPQAGLLHHLRASALYPSIPLPFLVSVYLIFGNLTFANCGNFRGFWFVANRNLPQFIFLLYPSCPVGLSSSFSLVHWNCTTICLIPFSFIQSH